MTAQAGFLRNAGFVLVPELKPNTEVGELVFSGIHAGAEATAANHYNRFVAGTVGADASSSHRYDPGGGINDVRVQPDHGTLLLTWSGGAPPYEVQQSTNPAWPWTNPGTATAATSLRLTPHGPRRFYRVTGNL